MHRKLHFQQFFIALISLAFMISCAQRSGITGGPKDTQAPQLVKANPDTFATNFQGDKIRLEFDEFVELNNVRRNLLVTPVLRYQPTVLASGKKVLIKNLDDSLWENTTYVMEFNEGIQDITERNASKGFRYVFSTGDYVDSLQISGEVKDAYTLKPLEDVFVFLYEQHFDSVPYLIKPRYVGRTNGDGIFSIRNMKQGEYKVFFSSDDNSNYLFDNPGEKIDFLDSLIEVKSDSGTFLSGRLFREDFGKQYLEGHGLLNKWAFYLAFKKKVDTLFISSESGNAFPDQFYVRDYNESRDSVVFWLTDTSAWQEEWNLIVKADTFPADSIKLTYYAPRKEKKAFKISQNISGGKLDLGEDLELYFDFPLTSMDTSKIFLLNDTIPIKYEYSLNKLKRTLTIKSDWQEEKNYKLIMDTAAFTDINTMSNDSTVRAFSTNEVSYYGTMEITLEGLISDYGILIIMDKNANIIEQVYLENKSSHFFKYLHPGEYYLKYILDLNKNERWDAGNYLEKRHSEPVFIYQGSITIRSNWDQVIEWKFK